MKATVFLYFYNNLNNSSIVVSEFMISGLSTIKLTISLLTLSNLLAFNVPTIMLFSKTGIVVKPFFLILDTVNESRI